MRWGHRELARWIATGFGVGTSAPAAPGTFGTLLAIPLYVLLKNLMPFEHQPGEYAVTVALLFLVGIWLCDVAERELGRHDPGAIVWDEIVGYLITMFLAPPGWFWILLGFGLFRLFDIWKPYPVNIADRKVPGGLGTMLDDAIAGVYAFITLQVIAKFLLPYY